MLAQSFRQPTIETLIIAEGQESRLEATRSNVEKRADPSLALLAPIPAGLAMHPARRLYHFMSLSIRRDRLSSPAMTLPRPVFT